MGDGEVLEATVEKTWIETGVDPGSPVFRGFVVRVTGGARYRLLYSEENHWEVFPIAGPRLVRGGESR